MSQAPWPKYCRALWFEPEVWRDLKFEATTEPADLADTAEDIGRGHLSILEPRYPGG